MKNCILCLLFFFVSTTINAQSVIGMSVDQIKLGVSKQTIYETPIYETFAEGSSLLVKLKEGQEIYDQSGGIRSITFYFDKQDKCVGFANIYGIEEINAMITSLNANYVKVSEFKWVDYAKDLDILLEKKDPLFIVIYKPK